jgi:MOSC domain-containing protein YiiM
LNFVSGNQKTRDHFAEKAWPGVYFEVLQEGEIKAGDKLFLKKRIQNEITVLDLFMALYNLEKREPISEQIRNIKKSPHVLERYKTRLKKFYIE